MSIRNYRLILRLLTGLSIAAAIFPAWAGDAACPQLRLNAPAPPAFGATIVREATADENLTLQPMLAGLKGPRITLTGRDMHLARNHQASPQELWHQARINDPGYPAPPCRDDFHFYPRMTLDKVLSPTQTKPSLLYRSRAVSEAILTTPMGFTFGAGLAIPIKTNADVLLNVPDARAPVRRDVGKFSQGVGVERLFASWRMTPITDLHLALSAGWLEEMYGGGGAEIVWRPFGSAFWLGADAWRLWRRDPESSANIDWTDERVFTGHIRAGYDMPGTQFSASLAAGKYLGGDIGATLALSQGIGFLIQPNAHTGTNNGPRIEASLGWSNRQQNSYFPDSHWDPRLRIVIPLGQKFMAREARMAAYQLGRDSAQMLDRPLPLETMTASFAARDYIHHWPRLFD